jgi:hypothetical protein
MAVTLDIFGWAICLVSYQVSSVFILLYILVNVNAKVYMYIVYQDEPFYRSWCI